MSQALPTPPSSTVRCRQLLQRWRNELCLGGRERALLAGELRQLDRQLQRLSSRTVRVAVFGRVGVGKSSLINALIGEQLLATDVAHGCTRRQQAVPWPQAIDGLAAVELIDTPGIDEIETAGRARLATRVAMGADLVLLVIDSDLTRIDRDALNTLLHCGKPVQLVLNRSDRWSEQELPALLRSIQQRLPRELPLTAVAAAPRRPVLDGEGRARSEQAAPRIAPLSQRLIRQLSGEGELLLALHALRLADRFQQAHQQLRLRQHRRSAQGLIGRYAAAKATGVAMNPLIAIDLAGGLACDTALVMQLCQLYGLPMAPTSLAGCCAGNGPERPAGRRAAGAERPGATGAAAGAIQRRSQPAPAAPVALAQAAAAVHSTAAPACWWPATAEPPRWPARGAAATPCPGGSSGAHRLQRWPASATTDLQPLPA